MSKTAVILAGGKGTRLRPYTLVLPKPLMPIGEFPILEVIIRKLAKSGFTRIILAVNHQADIIKAYFGDGSKWKITIEYSLESAPLSTMGPLRLIHKLPDHFLIMNGDVLSDVDFTKLYQLHLDSKNIFTVSGFNRVLRSEYGVLEVNASNYLCNFKEKPTYDLLVSMGIYVGSKEILNYIPEGVPYGFDHLMHDLMKAGTPAFVKLHSGYWLDIGRPDDYMQAIDDVASGKIVIE
jgi:NDP-sugar pyrophosphorylase family protein